MCSRKLIWTSFHLDNQTVADLDLEAHGDNLDLRYKEKLMTTGIDCEVNTQAIAGWDSSPNSRVS